MTERSKIEWCDSTFNPWIGCAKVSAGCEHCYAERSMGTWLGRARWGTGGTRARTSEAYWRQPIRWDREAAEAGLRRRVFCASLADVFEDRPELEPWRVDLWRLIDHTPNLDWMLLTKRPENIPGMLPHFFPNLWLGTSVEDQATADERIPHLLLCPAAVRFVSYEPALGEVDFGLMHRADEACGMERGSAPGYVRDFVGWIIAGGESGPQARPAHPDWFRSVRDQCAAAGVPFFFKQWGEWAPCWGYRGERYRARHHCFDGPSTATPFLVEYNGLSAANVYRFGKRAAGHLLDGVEHHEFPKVGG